MKYTEELSNRRLNIEILLETIIIHTKSINKKILDALRNIDHPFIETLLSIESSNSEKDLEDQLDILLQFNLFSRHLNCFIQHFVVPQL
jgi:hypothetical protein